MSDPQPQLTAPRGLLALLTAAAFLIFAQAFMIAPVLPRLAEVFGTTTGVAGLAVPAYLMPYGVMTLVWGPLSDRVGRRPVILGSLMAFIVLTVVTSLVDSAAGFIGMRVATAVGARGVVPIALALIGDLFPFQQRGRALGWLFGGMAGGIAVGSTAGALATGHRLARAVPRRRGRRCAAPAADGRVPGAAGHRPPGLAPTGARRRRRLHRLVA